jgi:hypothetical protein
VIDLGHDNDLASGGQVRFRISAGPLLTMAYQ